MRLLVNLVVVAATVAVAYARPQAEKEGGFETLPNGCPVNRDIHQLLPHESDCRLFYYCVNGEKVQRECSNPNTHFNPVLQVCDWIEAAGCQLGGGGGGGDGGGGGGGDGGGGDESDEYEGSGDPDIDGSDEESDILPNGCPADFDVHKLLPHETECNLFYYCVFGEKVQRECAPGTYFNYEIQVCDWPENVDCANSGGGGGAGGEIGPATEGPGVDSDENQGGEWLDNGCPADFDVHQLLPHETDCALFYYCVHGNKVLRECSPGTHFNPLLQVCDWPENAGCGSSGANTDSPGNDSGEDNDVTDGPGNGSSGPGNGSGEDNNVTEGPGNGSGEDNNVTDGPGNGSGETPGAGSGEWLENGCPADWSIHHLLPHETDCSLFYYCVHGNLELRECAPGTHFNPVLQVCDWPHNAGCTNGGGNTDSPGNGSGEDNNVTDGPGNGSGEDNNVTEGPGNGSGEDNNVTEGPGNGSGEDNNVTDGPGNGSGETPGAGSGEWLENGCPADWSIHHLLPHETDCSLFYYCVHGNLELRECAPGTHFNPVLQVCDWPQNAGCTNGEGNTDSPGNGSGEDNNVTDGPGNGSGEDNNVTEGPGNGSGEDNNVTDGPGNGSGETPGSGSGEWLENGCPADWSIHHLLPHETDCSLFYYCVHGNLELRECAPGTHFNPVLQVCDWPHNAGCTNGGGNTDSPGNGSGEDNNVTDGPGNGSGEDNNVTEGPGNGSGEDNNVTEGPGNGSGEDNNVTDGPGNGSGETPGAGSGEWLENGCPADWSIHHLLPHKTDCSLFYYCVHGNLELRECAPGTHFNPVLQVCDWPQNAGCTNGEGNTDSPGNGSGEDNNVTDGPGNGSGEDNNVTEGSGNGSGEDNNVTDGPGNGSGETPGSGSGEWLENGCPADWSIHHLLPHEIDCSLFYHCVHGNLVLRECAPGTHFNPVLQECDWPHSAGCISGGGNTDSPGNGSEEDNIVTEAPGNESEEVTDSPGNNSGENNGEVTEGPSTEAPGNESEENPGNGSEEDPSSPQDLICANDCHVGHWAHETDCDKFWKCKDGKAVLGVCSEGLHFNSEEQTCDFICNVNCVRDNIQATAGTDGLKLFVPWDKIDDKLLAAYRLLGI